ncbi:MAG TPA: helix-turn-helix transcriptional regulator [Candidatus Kapabacteria bacterium]|nr:helix-turn-helix transcriptional regulator [Candidatus Kapabacteria bacterium]
MKDDLDRIIEKRKKIDPEFAKGYEEGFAAFKIGVLLKLARERAGMTQEQVAVKLRTNKSAISRIENHADDIRLSTLHKYAHALGRKIKLEIA